MLYGWIVTRVWKGWGKAGLRDSRGDPQTLGDLYRPLTWVLAKRPKRRGSARGRQTPGPPHLASQTHSQPRTAAFLLGPGAGPADPTIRSENLKEAAGSRGSLTSRRETRPRAQPPAAEVILHFAGLLDYISRHPRGEQDQRPTPRPPPPHPGPGR